MSILTTEDKYRGSWGFMEGYINMCFRNSGKFTLEDRIKMHQLIASEYGVYPVGGELKKLCGLKTD